MYVARCDIEILHEDVMYEMQDEYERRFGERFIPFNYADFDGTKDKCAAQIYKETLEKALRENKPYHIVSRWKPLLINDIWQPDGET